MVQHRKFRSLAVTAVASLMALTSPTLAQPKKVLRIPMTTAGPGTLDPVMGSTTYENRAASCIYETLLQYKYLKRPLALEPLLLAEMPVVTEEGRVWHFKLRQDIYFQDDPCFKATDGKGRQLVSEDVKYSWLRLADPANKFKSYWVLDGLIEGYNEYRDEQVNLLKADPKSKFNYDAPLAGFTIVNDHEFIVELNEPNQQFLWRLAMFQTSVVPREAVETYGDTFPTHPVGTGPFILEKTTDWVFGQSMRVVKNPTYHDERYPKEWMPEDEALGLNARAGEQVPFVDEIQFTFFVENQPMWLEFKAGNLDFTTVGQSEFEEAFSRRTKELKRTWERNGIREVKVPLLDFIFRSFNMEDELLGGYTDQKRALRQAFNLAQDWDEMNETLYNGLSIPYDGPIPPGLDGHPNNKDHRAPFSTRGPNYELARQKLREAGYTVGADGKVTDLPVVDLYTSTGAESQRIVELLERNLSEVGIKLNPRYLEFPDLMQAVDNKKAGFFSFAWGSDYPDAENNLALFYGPNESPGSNHSNYKNAEFDRLYEKTRTMPPGDDRTKIYEQMRDMLIKDAPFCGSLARIRQYVINPWCLNLKPTEDFFTYYKYLDVDMSHEARGK